MTNNEKEKIRYWRGEGLGYKAIAAKAEVSESAIKSFCQRDRDGEYRQDTCRQCGAPIIPAQRKKFCCDACRNTWWNHHAFLREPRESDRRVCIFCGRVFFSSASAGRVYCGHPCYIAARFGKEAHHDA